MTTIRCSSCGEEHDPSDIEPSFDRPDAYFDVPAAERAARIVATDGTTVIDDCTPNARFFLRGVLVIPVRGGWPRDGCGWGVWSEVTESEFDRLVAAGNAEERADELPLFGNLANELATFPGSRGIPVRVRIQPPGTAPLVDVLAPEHPLGAAQTSGVFPEDVLEWISPLFHS
jgi:hypothetical protein